MLILIFLILYFILAIRRLDWSVMLFLFALPAYQVRFSLAGIPMTLLEAMILISFGVWFFKNWKIILEKIKDKITTRHSALGFRHFSRYPFDTEIILLLIIAFISIASAGFTDAAFGVFKAYFFEPVLVYILIFNVLLSKYSTFCFEKIVWPFALSAFCVSVYAILQKIGIFYSPENFWPRVTGPFFYPNAVGLYLGPLIALFIGWFLMKITNYKLQITNKYPISDIRYLKSIFILIGIASSLIAVFFAQSEGALIGLAAATVVMAMFWLMHEYKFGLFLSKALVGFIFLFVIASPFIYLKLIPEHKYFNFKNRVLNYIADKAMLKDFSGEVRKQQWRETWKMLSSNPKYFIFGAGLSGYKDAVKPFHQPGIFFNAERDPDFRRKLILFDDNYKAAHWRPVEIYMYPHNFVLNIWVELGLAGVMVFLWILYKIFNFQFSIFPPKADQPWAGNLQFPISKFRFIHFGLFGAFIVITIHGLVDVPYFKNDLSVMFFVLLALIGIDELQNKKKPD